ncbi:hypothetical protein D3C77_19960 [compost metagenome]|uniref:hypothetical protein n=2 Tax=Pseudomonas TaxID=286 RepID=UPI000FAEF5A6|nr:hypothetical protein [Pseudomonas donghuensis]
MPSRRFDAGFYGCTNGTVTSPWGAAQYAMMDSLLKLLDAQQRDVISIRLRSMLFAESVEPDDFAIPLSKYGHLIPDVQPSNPQEVQRIVLFLAYLSRNPDSLPALAKLFDAKAEQWEKLLPNFLKSPRPSTKNLLKPRASSA